MMSKKNPQNLKRQSLRPAGLGGVPARSCCIIDYLSVPNSCVCIWKMPKVRPGECLKSNKWQSVLATNRLTICCSSLCNNMFKRGPFSANFQSSSRVKCVVVVKTAQNTKPADQMVEKPCLFGAVKVEELVGGGT